MPPNLEMKKGDVKFLFNLALLESEGVFPSSHHGAGEAFLEYFLKIYKDNSSSETVKSGIEYTFRRFYLVHGESFLLQGPFLFLLLLLFSRGTKFRFA